MAQQSPEGIHFYPPAWIFPQMLGIWWFFINKPATLKVSPANEKGSLKLTSAGSIRPTLCLRMQQNLLLGLDTYSEACDVLLKHLAVIKQPSIRWEPLSKRHLQPIVWIRASQEGNACTWKKGCVIYNKNNKSQLLSNCSWRSLTSWIGKFLVQCRCDTSLTQHTVRTTNQRLTDNESTTTTGRLPVKKLKTSLNNKMCKIIC